MNSFFLYSFFLFQNSFHFVLEFFQRELLYMFFKSFSICKLIFNLFKIIHAFNQVVCCLFFKEKTGDILLNRIHGTPIFIGKNWTTCGICFNRDNSKIFYAWEEKGFCFRKIICNFFITYTASKFYKTCFF